MNLKKSKSITTVIFVVMVSYTLFSARASVIFTSPNKTCTHALYEILASRYATCQYDGSFSYDSVGEIRSTKIRLDDQFKKNNAIPSLAWFRAKFFRQYQSELNLSFEEINNTYWDFLEIESTVTKNHSQHIQYLETSGEKTLAQNFINKYCKIYSSSYLPRYQYNVLGSLAEALSKQKSSLNMKYCWENFEKLNPLSSWK